MGAADGNVYEVFLEPSEGGRLGGRREEKYVKNVWRAEGGVTGIWADDLGGRGDVRRVMVSTRDQVACWVGRVDRQHDGAVYGRFFEREARSVHDERGGPGVAGVLAVAPEEQIPTTLGSDTTGISVERAFAWLNAKGVFHGRLQQEGELSASSNKMLAEGKTLDRSKLPPSLTPTGRPKSMQEPVQSMILSQ